MAVTQSTTRYIKFAAAADALTGSFLVKRIDWVGASAAAHALILTDTAGNIKKHVIAQAANDLVSLEVNDLWDGIVAATMGSGTLYVQIA